MTEVQGRGDYRKRDDYSDRFGGAGGGSGPYIGKPATTFAEGVLTAPNNVVNVWKGPAWGGDSAATGRTIEADYSTGAFGTSDFVTVTTAKDGKKYVTCFPSGS